MRRWLALGLATCGVTAAIAVPLLTGGSSSNPPYPDYYTHARTVTLIVGSGSAKFTPLYLVHGARHRSQHAR